MDHVSYAFRCDYCSCRSFDPGPLPRLWLHWRSAEDGEIEIPAGAVFTLFGWHL
jgi:hypothetical protein